MNTVSSKQLGAYDGTSIGYYVVSGLYEMFWSHKIGFRADIFLKLQEAVSNTFLSNFFQIESGIMRT